MYRCNVGGSAIVIPFGEESSKTHVLGKASSGVECEN